MPKTAGLNSPKYRLHRPTGQAVVTIAGRDHYLGPWKSAASRIAFDRLIAEWLIQGRPIARLSGPLTVAQLLIAYWYFCESHYRNKEGQPTSELHLVRYALRPVKKLYAGTPALEFGPLALKAVWQSMIDHGLSRGVVNQHIGRVRRMFKWAVAEELIPVEVHQALATVTGLQRGRCSARETYPVRPIADGIVEATLVHLPAIVADMIRLQRLTGARPTEICLIRPADIDRTGEIWRYRPESHKTEHHDREREIYIGPQAKELLGPYLVRDASAYCFSPGESEQCRNVARRQARRTPITPSQAARQAKPAPKRTAGERYTNDSYRRAIHRACDLAFPPPAEITEEAIKAWRSAHRWSPNRLRHAAATEIRRRYGVEAAQVVLGHARADITQVYAERDRSLAEEVISALG